MSASVYKSKLENRLTLYTADTFFTRLRGLLFRRELYNNEALLLAPCNSVHSFGMKYELDVLFLDAKGNLIEMMPLKPNKTGSCWNAKMAIECKSGVVDVESFTKLINNAVSVRELK